MKINKSKRFLSSLLASTIIFSMTIPTFAESTYRGKEEVVYGMLKADGSMDEMYIVNIFDKNGKIVDYGDYEKIRNMTTKDKLSKDGEKITVNNTGDKLYYEGVPKDSKLPWNIDIKYFIDNKEYSPADIAGKSGALSINIKIDENEELKDSFYEDFAIQALVNLDTEIAKNIIAEDATIANVGKEKQLTYTVLPGKGADINIRADVENFEMDAISINGINLNLDIDIDDQELTDKVDELIDGVNEINNGANKLKDGAYDLTNGSDKLGEGAKKLQDGSLGLDNGVTSLKNGVDQIQNALNELNSKSSQLTKGSGEFKSALEELQRTLSQTSGNVDNIEKLTNASSQMRVSINELNSSLEQLKNNTGHGQYKANLKANGLDIDNLKSGNTEAINSLTNQIGSLTNSYNEIKDIPEYADKAGQLKGQIDELNKVIKLLKGNNAAINGNEAYLNKISQSVSSIHEGSSKIKGHYDEFDRSISQIADSLGGMLGNVSKLSSAVNTLVEKYSQIDSGINNYTDGVAKVVVGYKGVADGVGDLSVGSKSIKTGSNLMYQNMTGLLNGTSSLYKGTVDLADGTEKFKSETSDMNTEVQDQIDEILSELSNDDKEIRSFASNKNEEIKSVQFVIKTKDIKIKDVVEKEEDQAEELTFIDKLLGLFGRK